VLFAMMRTFVVFSTVHSASLCRDVRWSINCDLHSV